MIRTFPFVAVHHSPPFGTAGLRRIYTLYLRSNILYHYHLRKYKVTVLIHTAHFSSNTVIEVARLSSCLQEDIVTLAECLATKASISLKVVKPTQNRSLASIEGAYI